MSEIKPVAWSNRSIVQWSRYISEIVTKLTKHEQPENGIDFPLYSADALRQARDDALAAQQQEIERLKDNWTGAADTCSRLYKEIEQLIAERDALRLRLDAWPHRLALELERRTASETAISKIEPIGFINVESDGDVLGIETSEFPPYYTIPVYSAEALRQARDDALEEAADWLREAGVPWTAEQMLHELKEKK